MTQSLLAIAPGNLEIAGRLYYLEAGRTLVLSDEEANIVLRGPAASKFKLITSDSKVTIPLSIHDLGLPQVKSASKPAPAAAGHSSWATPFAPGTTVDTIQAPDAAAYQDTDFFGQAPMLQPLQPAQIQDGDSQAEIKVSHEIVSLPDDAHWSKVKAHLAFLAAAKPIDYDAIEALQKQFPKYEVIQKEAASILANR